jgi:hypothetical protein
MKIPIIDSLETQSQWQIFDAKKPAYAYIKMPLSLIDFQSNYLQITVIDKGLRDGRQAKKFSLGEPHSTKPIWTLIKSCQWSLSRLIIELKALDFSSNVRDNSALNIHKDLSIRQFFSKDKSVISPLLLQQYRPLANEPNAWFLQDIKQLLSAEQYTDLKWLTKNTALSSIKAVLLQLVSYPQGWRIDRQKHYLVLSLNSKFILRLRPAIEPTQSQPLLLTKL